MDARECELSTFYPGSIIVCPGGRAHGLHSQLHGLVERCNRPLGKVGAGLQVEVWVSPDGEPPRGTTSHKCRSCHQVIALRQIAA